MTDQSTSLKYRFQEGTVMYDTKEVGKRIKELRKQKGMTQDELADVFKTESSS